MYARRMTVAFAGLVALAAFGSAQADDIIYFTNGTSMAVRSHTVEKEMIRVDLGANATMAFPTYMVEKVERSGRPVFTNPAYVPSNQAIASSPDAGPDPNRSYDTTITGAGNVPSYARSSRRSRGPGNEDASVGAGSFRSDNDGLPSGPAAGRIRSVVRSKGRVEGDPLGTYRRGNSLVMDPTASAEPAAQNQAIGFGPKGSSGPAETYPSAPEPADEGAPPEDAPPPDGAESTEAPPADETPQDGAEPTEPPGS